MSLQQTDTVVERSSRAAIEVRGLWKSYRLYTKPTDVLREIITFREAHEKFYALKDISFSVGKGEVVGVLGRNGAGKSTLLKVIAGVLENDRGSVDLNGRVAAILELGTGLNPNDSGRENVIFGGICRGETRADMLVRFDEIVEFAGLEDVIDRPFKTYSSGMQARLLFSIAIHVSSDILIIDEALAAGDALFQEKCNTRMREIAASGRTIFFVSHSPSAVQQLCSRGMVLHEGKLVFDGTTEDASHCYEGILAEAREKTRQEQQSRRPVYLSHPDEETKAGMRAYVVDCSVVDQNDDVAGILQPNQRYSIVMRIAVVEALAEMLVTANIRMPSGLIVHAFHNLMQDLTISGAAGDILTVIYDFDCLLGGGEYTVAVGLGERAVDEEGKVVLSQIQSANSMASFAVPQAEKFGGILGLGGEMRVSRQQAETAA